MLRAVLAVVVAVALLAVTVPAMEPGAVDGSNERVNAELDALEAAATELARANDPTPHGPGARARVTLHLPGDGWGTARVETLELPPIDRPGSVVTWRIDGDRRRHRHLEGPPVLAEDVGDLGSGRVRLTLWLRTVDGETTVVVTRPNFMSDEETSAGHAFAGDAPVDPPRAGR